MRKNKITDNLYVSALSSLGNIKKEEGEIEKAAIYLEECYKLKMKNFK
jgi:hypothetical protein